MITTIKIATALRPSVGGVEGCGGGPGVSSSLISSLIDERSVLGGSDALWRRFGLLTPSYTRPRAEFRR